MTKDNPSDIELTRRSLQRNYVANQLVVRKPAASAESTPQLRVPPQRLSCKTCLGKRCIGRCRF